MQNEIARTGNWKYKVNRHFTISFVATINDYELLFVLFVKISLSQIWV